MNNHNSPPCLLFRLLPPLQFLTDAARDGRLLHRLAALLAATCSLPFALATLAALPGLWPQSTK